MTGLDFLKMYSSKSTVNTYRFAIRAFLQVTYGRKIESRDLVKATDQYLAEDRDRQKDIEGFLASLQGRPPKTIRLFIAVVKIFLLENKFELPQLYWRRLRGRIKGSRALTMDKIPSNLELRKIIQHLPIQGKALFLFLASSGARIGETLQLKVEDIDLTASPAKVTMRGEYTKTGNPRTAFFSSETREAIEEWLKVRQDYLKAAVGKSWKYGKSSEDPSLFPFQISTAYSMWLKALEKSGLAERDSSTRRQVSHIHVLRKFFRTRMGGVIPFDVAESLMGHEGYLTEIYRKYSIEDLSDFYKKGEGALSVFTNGAETSKLRIEIEEKNKQLQTIINGLASENMEMRDNIRQLRTEAQEEKTLREKNNDLFTELLEKQLRNVAEAKKDIDFLKQKIFSLEEEEPKPKDNLFS